MQYVCSGLSFQQLYSGNMHKDSQIGKECYKCDALWETGWYFTPLQMNISLFTFLPSKKAYPTVYDFLC